MWLPSRNGLLFDSPQRHGATWSPYQAFRPLPALMVSWPASNRGPSVNGLIASFPPPGPASAPRSPTDPESRNPACSWLLSQKGLFFECPHRHRAARNLTPAYRWGWLLYRDRQTQTTGHYRRPRRCSRPRAAPDQPLCHGTSAPHLDSARPHPSPLTGGHGSVFFSWSAILIHSGKIEQQQFGARHTLDSHHSFILDAYTVIRA